MLNTETLKMKHTLYFPNFFQKRKRNTCSNVKNQNVRKNVDLDDDPNLSIFSCLFFFWKKLNFFFFAPTLFCHCAPCSFLHFFFFFLTFARILFSLTGWKLISQPPLPADFPQRTSFQLPGAHNTSYSTTKQEQNVTGLCFYSQFAIITFFVLYNRKYSTSSSRTRKLLLYYF